MSTAAAVVGGIGNPVPPHLPKGPDVSKITAAITAAFAKAKAAAEAAWKREPVRVLSGVTAVVVFLAAKFGVVVPEASILQALGLTLPILLGGAVARSRVTPTS